MPVPNRPFAVTCLIGLVLTLTGLQVLRLLGVLSFWETLNDLPLNIPPAVLGLSALIWTAIGLLLAWGMWRAKAWAPRATRLAAIVFVAWHWLDRSFLQAAGSQSNSWPFDLLLSTVLLASVIIILAMPKARAYFGENV